MKEKAKLSDIHQGDSLPTIVKHLSQQKINLYAEASGDYNPIHIDEAFAAKTPLGGTIAHGMLILAYASEMMTKAFGQSWLEGGKLSIRFKAAARPQDIGARIAATHDPHNRRQIVALCGDSIPQSAAPTVRSDSTPCFLCRCG